MRRLLKIALVAAVFACCAETTPGSAQEDGVRNPVFEIPERLRPRINFWKDIFTKYGKNNAVMHHRDYPQVVFKALDFTVEASILGPNALASLRKRVVDDNVAEIRAALQHLADGKAPEDELQLHVQHQMLQLGPGTAKYKNVLDNNLIRSQTGIKEKYADAIARSGRYMHIMEKIFVEDFNLPVELTRLPFIESSFDYTAYSSAGAAGIWQFMPRTGRQYLTINNLVDERRDPIESTRAAAKYLAYSYNRTGTWPLAITGYNHGPYGVARRVREMGTSDIAELIEHPTNRVFGFASNNFYPEFLAALEIYDDYRSYFPRVRKESPLSISELRLTQPVSVRHIVNQTGVDIDSLRSVNYALSDSIWRGVQSVPRGYVLKVPTEYAVQLASLNAASSSARSVAASSIYGGSTYTVRSGDTLSVIARRYGSSVADLKALNGLSSDLVRVGQVLVVSPRENQRNVIPGTSVSYTVRPGDTISEIAESHGMTTSEVMAANNLSSSTIGVGQVLSLRQGGGGSSGTVSYTVSRGDTLYQIARRHGTNVQSIMSLNGLSSSTIAIGQVLKIETSGATSSASRPQTYRVQSGDSLWSVSQKFNVSIAELRSANGIRGSNLRIGQTLRIP